MHVIYYQVRHNEDNKYLSSAEWNVRLISLGLLERDPDDRFGGEELMAHEWFAKIDWKLLLEKKSMLENEKEVERRLKY